MKKILTLISPSAGVVINTAQDFTFRYDGLVQEDSFGDFATGTLSNAQAIEAGALTLSGTPYATSGYRKSPGYAIGGTATASSIITWTATVPANTTLTIKTAVTADSTPPDDEAYAAATNGQLPPGIAINDDLTGKYLWIWQEMTTTDTASTPTVSLMDVNINQVISADTVTAQLSFDVADVLNIPSPARILTANSAALSLGQTATWSFTLTHGYWYWRAVSGALSSTARMVEFNLPVKRTLSVYENIGKAGPDWASKRILYVYENIGKLDIWSNERALYEYENITDEPPFPTIYGISNTRGAAGSVVTIMGTGFGYKYADDTDNTDRFLRGYGGRVYIGGLECSVVSWSWTEITITIPAVAVTGAVKVSLTKPDISGIRDSNLIGFEVYAAEFVDDVGIEFFICDATSPNTILYKLAGAIKKSFQVLLNTAGSGKFAISRSDINGDEFEKLAMQNFILCRYDGVDVFKWIIESVSPLYYDESGQQMIDVSGRGILSLLEKAVVYPDGMPVPTSIERTWSNAHAGAILRQLIVEAQARGCFPGLVIDWTASADSIGNPWTDDTSISFHAGAPLTEVISKFTTGMGIFDIEITPDMVIKVYASKGEDMSNEVVYRFGNGLIDCKKAKTGSAMGNVVLVEGSGGGIVETLSSESIIDYGRKETYLQAGNIPNEYLSLENHGQSYLRNASTPEWTITTKVAKHVDSQGVKTKPFETYIIGDWIYIYVPAEKGITEALNDRVRVVGITAEEDDSTGLVLFDLDLNNIKLEHEIRMNQMLQQMSMYSAGSSLSSPATSSGSGDHNHSHGTLLDLDADDHEQYYNATRHASDPHSVIQRVAGIRAAGEEAGLSGEVTITGGDRVTITQDDEEKTVTIDIEDAYDMATTGGYLGTLESFKTDLASIEGLAAAIVAIVG